MESTSIIALSRQGALRRQMDSIANNIANMNTQGFKQEQVMFTDFMVRSKGGERIQGDKVAYVRDLATFTDFQEGEFKKTDNPLDMALHGDGFFAVQTPQGERYTRAGHFQLDQTGQLVTSDGHPVLSDVDAPFFFAPTDTDIRIARDGTVSTENGQLGRLKVVEFENRQTLTHEPSGLFSTDSAPQVITRPDVVQGMLEQSNVNSVLEMTKMIEVNRSYSRVSQIIQDEDERIKKMMQAYAPSV